MDCVNLNYTIQSIFNLLRLDRTIVAFIDSYVYRILIDILYTSSNQIRQNSLKLIGQLIYLDDDQTMLFAENDLLQSLTMFITDK